MPTCIIYFFIFKYLVRRQSINQKIYFFVTAKHNKQYGYRLCILYNSGKDNREVTSVSESNGQLVTLKSTTTK